MPSTTIPVPPCFDPDGDGPFVWIEWSTSKLPPKAVPFAIEGSPHVAQAIVDHMEEHGDEWPWPVGTLHVVARNPHHDPDTLSMFDGDLAAAEWIHSTAEVKP